MARILIIEDETAIAELEKDYLELSDFEVVLEPDGSGGAARALDEDFDLIILDLMLPEVDGFEICRQVREAKNTPIIMVSAKKDDIDKIRGLGLGADDYIMKPFDSKELVARVKAVFRRLDGMGADKTDGNTIGCRDLVIYPAERRVAKVKDGKETDISFTAMEFDFLNFMISNKNRVFTRDQLLKNIWDYQYIADTRAVDDLVKRIRKKLDASETDFCIDTVWGYGYKVTDYPDRNDG